MVRLVRALHFNSSRDNPIINNQDHHFCWHLQSTMKRPPMATGHSRLLPRSPKGHACLVEGVLGALVPDETHKLTPLLRQSSRSQWSGSSNMSPITNIHWMFHKHKQQREQYSCLKQYMATSPKIAISQSVRSSCDIGSTSGILTVFLKTGLSILLASNKNQTSLQITPP